MSRSDPSRGIFISYRRDDTSGFAGRLYDRLAARYGSDRVFMDIDTIKPSSDFSVEIERALSNSAACIVLIGRQWVSVTKDDGTRRLDDPTDFVRLEVGAAIRRGIAVFPVLVDGATPPSASALPDDLRALAERQAIELSSQRWNYDVGRLILALDEVVEEKRQRPRPDRPRWPIVVTAAVIAVLAAGIGAWAVTRDGTDGPDGPSGPTGGGSGSTATECAPGDSLGTPSGTTLEGVYSVEIGEPEISGDPATKNLWGEIDPDRRFVDTTWDPQTWLLSTTCGTWRVLDSEDHEDIDTTGATISGSTAMFSATSPKELPTECSDTSGDRTIDVVPKDEGMMFRGTLLITYTCTGPFRAEFPIEGTWQEP